MNEEITNEVSVNNEPISENASMDGAINKAPKNIEPTEDNFFNDEVTNEVAPDPEPTKEDSLAEETTDDKKEIEESVSETVIENISENTISETVETSSPKILLGDTEPPPEEAYNEVNFEKLPENTDPNIDTITVQSVCKTYKGRQVVNHVSLEIKKGEIVGLLGPNGAGKTTTFYMVVGLVKPDEGKVLYNHKDITKKAMYQRARMGIGYLPQEASVFRKLTVRENIWLILENIDISEKERKERLDMLLTDLDIGRISESQGYALSGGERRRVEIARALAAEPSFILLDEPFAGVDPIAVSDIQKIVLKLQKKGLGLLITDHNVSETLAIVDRAYILSLGKILVSGSAQFVSENPTARKYYLGDRFKLDQIKKAD